MYSIVQRAPAPASVSTCHRQHWTARRPRQRGTGASASGIVPRRGSSSPILLVKRFPLLRRRKCNRGRSQYFCLCFSSSCTHAHFFFTILHSKLPYVHTLHPPPPRCLRLCLFAALPRSSFLRYIYPRSYYFMSQRSLLLLSVCLLCLSVTHCFQ